MWPLGYLVAMSDEFLNEERWEDRSGAGAEFLPLGCRAKAHLTGLFFHAHTHTHAHTSITL